MKIMLDFDGTVVEHEFPKMGRCNYGCMEVIKKLQDAGHDIVLNTYRADCTDGSLQKAIDYIMNGWMVTKDRDADFQIEHIKVSPTKRYPLPFDINEAKENGVLYIDDQQANVPLKNCVMTRGDMVDWDALDKIFQENGIYAS